MIDSSTVHGSMATGYAIHIPPIPASSSVGFPGSVIPPPAMPTGACCIDGACTITTEAECLGVWQGEGTDCSSNLCSGACCVCGTCYSPVDFAFCEDNFSGACHQYYPDLNCADVGNGSGEIIGSRTLSVSGTISGWFSQVYSCTQWDGESCVISDPPKRCRVEFEASLANSTSVDLIQGCDGAIYTNPSNTGALIDGDLSEVITLCECETCDQVPEHDCGSGTPEVDCLVPERGSLGISGGTNISCETQYVSSVVQAIINIPLPLGDTMFDLSDYVCCGIPPEEGCNEGDGSVGCSETLSSCLTYGAGAASYFGSNDFGEGGEDGHVEYDIVFTP